MQGSIQRHEITGIILAGGRSRRMGGVDKAFVELQGKPLIAWVIESMRGQAGQIAVITNRPDEKYATLGCPLIRDVTGPDIGPLAGILTGLEYAQSEYVLTAPCDMPFLPSQTATRLMQRLETSGARAATLTDGNRVQPVIALLDRKLAAGLRLFLESGRRSVADWLESTAAITVDFSALCDAFINMNTPADVADCRRRLELHYPATAESLDD